MPRRIVPPVAAAVVGAALLRVGPVAAQGPAVAALGRAADSAWVDGRRGDARLRYEEILRRDSAAMPRAVFRLATLEAWDGRYDQALQLYGTYLRLAPADAEGRAAMARTLAWAGRYDEAERAYDTLAARGDSAQARKGIARVAAWRGDLRRSEMLWRDAVRRMPGDAEAWVGLAEVLRWSGRPTAASDALRRAVAINPLDGDALDQQRWVTADLKPALEPTFTDFQDSDANRTRTVAFDATLRPLDGSRVGLGVFTRSAELRTAHGLSTGAHVTARLAPTRSTGLNLVLGGTRTSGINLAGAGGNRATLDAGVHVVVRPTRTLVIGAGAEREAFDETAPLMAAGIVTTSGDLNGALSLSRRMAIDGGVEYTSLRGATPNARWSAHGEMRWQLRRTLTVATGGRTFGYDTATADGYFAPRRFTLLEASMREEMGGELGWFGWAEGGIGRQALDAVPGSVVRPAGRAALAVGFRPDPGREMVLRVTYADAAGGPAVVSTAARYQALAVTFGAKLAAW